MLIFFLFFLSKGNKRQRKIENMHDSQKEIKVVEKSKNYICFVTHIKS